MRVRDGLLHKPGLGHRAPDRVPASEHQVHHALGQPRLREALEQQRGISVTSSVMQFPYRDRVVNLLDTPGHEDFSEDTYRTLTAVDSALMVIDSAKGVEQRTIKLMEVCRLRNTPIIKNGLPLWKRSQSAPA